MDNFKYVAIVAPQQGALADWYEPSQTITVHEIEDAPKATGLLDANGVKLFRVPVINPMGFHR
jgi:hypothetical protein